MKIKQTIICWSIFNGMADLLIVREVIAAALELLNSMCTQNFLNVYSIHVPTADTPQLYLYCENWFFK